MEWEPDHYEEDHSYVYGYGEDVLELLSPEKGEKILDLGCGTGDLTKEIAWEVGDGTDVIGVDMSPEMVETARSEHTDDGVSFIRSDARELGFENEFDAVFSNAALHWMDEPRRVAESVCDALVPEGRFVAEMGGNGNVGSIVSAVSCELDARGYDYINPWYFPRLGEYCSLLENAGFEVRYAHLFDRPTRLEGNDGLRSWLEMFGDTFFVNVPDSEVDDVIDAVEGRTRNELYDDEKGDWIADYMRLRFVAYKRR